MFANKSNFRRRKLLRLYKKKLKQKFNKFKWRKVWLHKKKVKIIRVYSFRGLIRKGAMRLSRACNYAAVSKQTIKTLSPLNSIVVNLHKKSQMRGNFKKCAAVRPSLIKPTKLGPSRPKEESMIYLFCNRIIADNERGVSRDALVDLYTQTYISLYKSKKKLLVLRPTKTERAAVILKTIEKPAAKAQTPRKHSKNWIDPEIWRTMSGKARREFLIKTGKFIERKPANGEQAS